MKDLKKNSGRALDKVLAIENLLDKALANENLEIAQRHLKRYAEIMSSIEAPYGEISSELQNTVDKILENL